jgi:hypothetical protein
MVGKCTFLVFSLSKVIGRKGEALHLRALWEQPPSSRVSNHCVLNIMRRAGSSLQSPAELESSPRCVSKKQRLNSGESLAKPPLGIKPRST